MKHAEVASDRCSAILENMERPTSALHLSGLLSACDSSEQSRIQRRSVVTKSTTIIAFDQHAATTVAAVLLPGHRTPALHPLASDSPTIIRFVERVRRQGDRKSTRLNSSHLGISYAVFCLK